MSRARVRPALPEDAMLLATLQRTWWQDAYSDLLPADVLATDPQMLADRWSAQLAGAWVLLAEENTHPVGFALVDPRVANGVGTIELLGVLPRWARRGHGGRLLLEATRRLREAGAATGMWWAPETDTSIEAFLAGVGWAAAGRRRVLDTGDGKLVEIAYTGPVTLEFDDSGESAAGDTGGAAGRDPHAGHRHG